MKQAQRPLFYPEATTFGITRACLSGSSEGAVIDAETLKELTNQGLYFQENPFDEKKYPSLM